MAEEPTPTRARSGEWSEMDELRSTCHRIEKKLDASISSRNEDQKDFVRYDERLKGVEAWQKERDDARRQISIGTILAIIGSIASPVAVIAFEVMRHSP